MKIIYKLINKNLQVGKYLSFFKKTEERKNWPLITISREKGAGGRIVALALPKKLGSRWKVYHREIAEEIASMSKSQQEQVAEIDEKEIPYLEEVLGTLTGRKYLSLDVYHRTLFNVFANIAASGYAIIVGRGANFLFKDALKVRIIADLDQRLSWLMKYEKLSEKDAKALIKKSDKERRDFIYNLFGHDVDDPRHYDVVIKTSEELTAKDVTDIIAKTAKKKFKLA